MDECAKTASPPAVLYRTPPTALVTERPADVDAVAVAGPATCTARPRPLSRGRRQSFLERPRDSRRGTHPASGSGTDLAVESQEFLVGLSDVRVNLAFGEILEVDDGRVIRLLPDDRPGRSTTTWYSTIWARPAAMP